MLLARKVQEHVLINHIELNPKHDKSVYHSVEMKPEYFWQTDMIDKEKVSTNKK